MYNVFPKPKYEEYGSRNIALPDAFPLSIDEKLKADCKDSDFDYLASVQSIFPTKEIEERVQEPSCIFCIQIEHVSCHKEGYELTIDAGTIKITCEKPAGLFYAMKTLRQLADQCGDTMPNAHIIDEPQLNIRGLLLDIGRDKIPSMDTLYRLIDKVADLRINHLELYMEGFSFDYEKYRYLFTDDTPITAEEFRSLSEYAAKNFIDLVPNLNVLGHMERWLEKPQLNSLAECEDGYLFEELIWRAPMTLDVYDEGSFTLAKELIDDLISNSNSNYINVNMDEPFEMGMGKNKAYADKNGRIPMYFDYLKKINEHCKSKNKRMFIWGDEILAHPECVTELPNDIILMDWIYESEAPFDEHAKLMQKTGMDYCLCPGTSSWGTLTGRSDNMKKNIANAADCAIKYGGKGIITTDWGDLGHWQYLSVSYLGYAYAGLYSWSGVIDEEKQIEWYCNRYIYEDTTGKAFQTAYDLGSYYHLENASVYNTTVSFAAMSRKYVYHSIEEFDQKMEQMLQLCANIGKLNHIPEKEAKIDINYTEFESFYKNMTDRINALDLSSEEGPLIQQEMLNGLAMVMHGMHLYRTMKEYRNDKEKFLCEIRRLYELLDEILKKHYELWRTRNRMGGFSRSTAHMLHLLKLYRKFMKEM